MEGQAFLCSDSVCFMLCKTGKMRKKRTKETASILVASFSLEMYTGAACRFSPCGHTADEAPNLDESRKLTMSDPLEVFCCYAREDQEMMALLKKYLTPLLKLGQITMWSDTNLNEGVEWEKELHQHLESADLILLLISPDFLASNYCYSIEMRRAIERHEQ